MLWAGTKGEIQGSAARAQTYCVFGVAFFNLELGVFANGDILGQIL